MGSGKDKIVTVFAKKLQRHFSVQKLVLFGSRATNTNLKDSDYDFLIVSSSFEQIPFLDRVPSVIRKNELFFSG